MSSSARVSAAEPAQLATSLRAELERLAAAANTSELCFADVAVTPHRAEALIDVSTDGNASYWAEPGGYEYAGVGALRVIEARGAERFQNVSAELRDVFERLGPDAGKLRLLGGFAFQPGRAATPAWRPLGEARFVVPRLVYQRRGDGARLGLLLTRDELRAPEGREEALALASNALAALAASHDDSHAPPESATFDERPDDDYLALVEELKATIERGDLEKLVLARRISVELPRPVIPPQALRRLSAIAPECIRFAFRAGATTFLGATPERLVEKTGRIFETEAVAGSIGTGEASLRRLMESPKDRAEQAIVVRELVHALEPVASRLDHAPVPEIHRLRHVAHLRTRIQGILKAPLHVLDLVERLHPTPAVGGVPTARAMRWIAAHEPDERGWYAGPIGWVDAQGDGLFAVALRSGLLEGGRGSLYAGAGIVHGSDARGELAETRWKLQALLLAFGVAP
jgi:isochorismate synthase